MMMNMIMSALY